MAVGRRQALRETKLLSQFILVLLASAMAVVSDSRVPSAASEVAPHHAASTSARVVARNPRRSSIPSRVIHGLDESFTADLLSDDEDFFGSDEEDVTATHTESEEESGDKTGETDSPAQHVSENWSCDEEPGLETAAPAAAAAAEQVPDVDVTEDEISAIQAILDKGCGCADVKHVKSLSAENLALHKKRFQKLSARERDMYLCGILSNASQSSEDPRHSKKSQRKERKRVTYEYTIMSHEVCRPAFMTMYSIGRTHLKRLQHLMTAKVFFPQQHGNAGRTPYNAFPEEVRDHAVSFIKNYAKVHGLPMPAAPRGRAQDAPTYLPTSSTYVSVHAAYMLAAQNAKIQTMRCKLFTALWHDRCPTIKFMKRREDVCAHCERLRADLTASKSEDDRTKCMYEWQDHIQLAQLERKFYNDCTVQAMEAAKLDDIPYTHLTFDFAENFALPNHARQPGPVYFKVLFWVNDFGVMNEGQQQQRHYLFTEAQCIGPDNTKSHGPNSVISMLDHYLESSTPCPTLHLHCDNCVGQNKNKSLMAYLAWRILTGKQLYSQQCSDHDSQFRKN